MVILSKNPYAVEKEEIKNLKVEKLLLAGKEYRSTEENVIKAAVRGLVNRRKA